jgi:Ca2+-binding RTX toxin-like protein
MATASAYTPFNMDTFAIWDGTTTITTPTQFQITNGAQVQNYFGTGFTYSGGAITGGTLNATEYLLSAVKQYEVTGLSHDMMTVNSYLATHDAQALLGYLLNGNDIFNGSSGNDLANGYAGSALLFGNSGDDTLVGGFGDDVLNGGVGYDYAKYTSAAFGVTVNLAAGTASGGAGNDTLSGIEAVVGSAYNDTITGDALNNWVEAGGGNDALYGNAGDDALLGGVGSDYLVGGDGNDYLDGGADFDYVDYTSAASGVTVNVGTGTGAVSGGAGNDTLIGIEYVQGSAFADVLTGGAGNEVLSGGSGNDYLWASAGNDELNGGAGADYADFLSATSGVTADLAAGTASGGAGNDILVGIEYLIGGSYNDTLRGNASGNWIDGREGTDDLRGNGGNDALLGGAGNDYLDGGAGNDYLDGGAGTDYVDYASATSGVTVNLAAGTASGGAGNDTLTGIEYVLGSGFNDTFIGDGVGNWVDGRDQTDDLRGNGGDDTLLGGAGNDYLDGGAGNDYLDGGAGTDYVDYTSATSGVTVNLAAGTASGGGAGNDTLLNIEQVRGSAYNDTIMGGDVGLFIYGLEGNDDLRGGTYLYGGPGTDYLDGGPGGDDLHGDDPGSLIAVADTFVLRPGDGGATLAFADLINDFQDGVDMIGLGGGLAFADLTITQGTGEYAADAIIQITATGEYLARVWNFSAASLDALDFKPVA